MYDRHGVRDAESDHDGPNAVTAPRKRALRVKRFDVVQNPLRAPPHSTEAEQSVLGALLLDNTALGRISDILTVDDFYDGTHRALFGAIASLITEGRPADVVTVADELTSVDKLEYIGGMTYLRSLVEEVPTAANIRAYGLTVRDRAQRRRLAAVGIEIADLAMGTAAHDAATLLDDAAEKIDQLRVDASASSSTRRALNWPVLAAQTPPAASPARSPALPASTLPRYAGARLGNRLVAWNASRNVARGPGRNRQEPARAADCFLAGPEAPFHRRDLSTAQGAHVGGRRRRRRALASTASDRRKHGRCTRRFLGDACHRIVRWKRLHPRRRGFRKVRSHGKARRAAAAIQR